MNAVIFTRVSSVGQEDGVSLDAQEAKLLDYCREKSLDILETFRVVESSTRGDRKQFFKALSFIEKQKKRTVLLVHSIDRLLRGFKEYGLIETLIEQDKLEIHAYNERLIINKNTPWTEQLQFDFSILGAKLYVGQIRQHVNKAIEFKLSKGEVVGNVPVGYLNVRDPESKKATVTLDSKRAFLVKRLFQEYATGTVSMGELAKLTGHWGLTSTRTGKTITKASMANILKNPFYYGEMMVRGITQETYDKKRLQLQAERQSLGHQIMDYTKDDSEFRNSFVTLLQVISRAASTFKSSKVEQKRKILSLVFSNLWLEGQNVRYELNKPFDKIVNLPECKEWWAILDSNQ